MKSWLKGNVRVFRQGYKDGRELARKMHRWVQRICRGAE